MNNQTRVRIFHVKTVMSARIQTFNIISCFILIPFEGRSNELLYITRIKIKMLIIIERIIIQIQCTRFFYVKR